MGNVLVKKKLRKILTKKAGISYFEIFVLIVSVFAFSYVVYETSKPEQININAEDYNNVEKVKENKTKSSFLVNFISLWLKRSKINIVSAADEPVFSYNQTLTETVVSQQNINWNCCLENKNGAICEEYPASNCNSNCKASCLPSSCSQISSCKLGCCFDENEGLCSANSPKGRCESENGKWNQDKNCNLQECKLGCCVIGSNVQFVSEKRCELLSKQEGLKKDFKSAIETEIECLGLSYTQVKGACVIDENCKYATKQECLKLQGVFNPNLLCTNSLLNTTCKKTKDTVCVEGKDEVYFKDSCGNIANIYDSGKVDDVNYWSKIVGKNESCGISSENGNADNPNCGNCERFLGSFCGKGNAKIGNNICKSLDCKQAPNMVDALGKVLKSKDRKNGESWCVYDSYIGEGKDVVGSRHFKYYCLDGEVKIEACADFRQEVCVSSEIKNEGKSFSSASCRVNRWRECLDYNNLAEKKGESVNYDKVKEKCEANEDCYLKELNFGEGYKFWQCLPNYPSGFDLNANGGEEINSKVCSMANFDCVKIEVKEITGWKCVAGCDCTSKSYTQQMNDWCISLGDCGGYVNILGKSDDAYSVDGAPKIDLSQYSKFVNPVEGKKAEPGDISEILAGQMGLALGPEGYVVEEASLIGTIKGIIGLKGIELAAFGIAGITPGITAGKVTSVLTLGIVKEFSLGAFGAQALAGIAGTIAGYLVAKMFGLQGQASAITMAAGGVGGMIGGLAYASYAATVATGGTATGLAGIAGSLAPQFLGVFGFLGPAFVFGLIAAIVVAIVMKLLGIGETRETHVKFTCYPWQAPTGGQDCEKINNNELKTGSKYRCESLGQACELINEGSIEEKCFWNNKNDASAPIIKPWKEILSPGYKYEENTDGIKIKTDKGECIQAYTPLLFGIKTDELSQCKFDSANNEYDNMADYFGLDNLYRTNHSMPFTIPSPEAFANEFNLTYKYVLDKIGNLRFYVKCQDKNGNKNIKPYLIDLCIKPGPDKTAPMILAINPGSGSYMKFGVTSQDVTLFVNEPSECKWTLLDKSYDGMENTMTCITGLQQASLLGWTCSASLPMNLSLSKFYFKCKDQPWIVSNESARNVNQQSFVYELKKSKEELKINKIEPSGTIKAGIEPVTIILTVSTGGGAENGKADCSFRFSQDSSWIQFLNTFSNIHIQEFNQMLSGNHKIYVKCKDIAENIAEGETEFNLELDTSPPKIIRVYNSGMLKIFTNEEAVCVYDKDCDFAWNNATAMEGLGKEHTTTWYPNTLYYIKCEDKYGHRGNCFIIKTL